MKSSMIVEILQEVRFKLQVDYAERFMNVVINNPNLLDDLHLNYQTNYFVLSMISH